MSISSIVSRRALPAFLVAASVTGASQAVVTRWNCNLAIPVTTSGIYIDIDTRTSSTDSFVGWDLQLYSSDPSVGALTSFGAMGTSFMRAQIGRAHV